MNWKKSHVPSLFHIPVQVPSLPTTHATESWHKELQLGIASPSQYSALFRIHALSSCRQSIVRRPGSMSPVHAGNDAWHGAGCAYPERGIRADVPSPPSSRPERQVAQLWNLRWSSGESSSHTPATSHRSISRNLPWTTKSTSDSQQTTIMSTLP